MSAADLIQRLDIDLVSALDETERRQVLQACDRLKAKLETPMDTTARLVFSSHQAMAVRLGIDMKLFDAMAKASKLAEDPFNVQDWCEETGSDPLLVRRITRFLAAMGVIQEIDGDSYTQTPLAAAYVSSSPLSAAVIHSTHFLTVLSRLPEYFHVNGWKSPGDGLDGPFQFALGADGHYFDFLSTHPYYSQAFNTVMGMSFRRRGKDWFEVFPVEERLRVSSSSDPLIVDVGGGQGEDLKKFQEHFSDLPGKLVLQDLPAVIEGVKDLSGIEVQSHDFFQKQPVQDAKVYFLRTVLHDWPDKQAIQILGNLRDAMSRESILLISEIMQPESGVPLPSVLSDMQMMGSFASLERTQAQWQTLLKAAGFELVQVWLSDRSPISQAEQPALLEARVSESTI
ncbi:hypothetical protein N7448_003138 [Penicillium atrosanguineum]|uniref:uncharacterized protein n=1 Tax=Penicillium atrosanguineum TaxID=1132637 RepID=UPI00238E5B62|nr:uncharacterized protein N7443_002114 [Penicillium atrosanguineum]KAJ5139730.1 hypothetical protein N7448_003138 [Penicillium atrosanguineum]KAJ5309653.1 hypothetical protein N7443_002114 [Penicillium atrosanguineum]